MKPICVPCERFMRCTKVGRYFTEGMPIGYPVKPGLKEPEKWKPYKVWVGDEYTCPDCGAKTIVGVPLRPIVEHYEPDFTEQQKRLEADTLLVKDC